MDQNESWVSLTGVVNSPAIKEIKLNGVIDNSIGGYGEQYVTKVDSNLHFSIEIPIERQATTRISAGRINQDMVLNPGDEERIQNYPRRYAYMNKIKIDSLVLPEEYIRLKQLGNFVDDKKVVSFNYIHNLRNFLSTKAREVREHYALEYQESIRAVLNDSLTGKTQEYLMAKWIISELSMSKFDSLAYQDFLALERDQNNTETVNKAYSKYKEKQALIGQALHPSFQENMLEDSTHSPLSIQEMMSSYQGKPLQDGESRMGFSQNVEIHGDQLGSLLHDFRQRRKAD